MPETPLTIEWLDWGPAAFTRAQREDKPILLALVAPWSEQCTAMDRTTYACPEVARLVDTRFVPVRVDTDRRPDINERYNLGGWPTTAFLTPDGQILGGGTFVEEARMPAVLESVANAFERRRDEINARVEELEECGSGASATADVERATPREVGLEACGAGASATADGERATPRDVGLDARGGGAPRALIEDPVEWLSSQLLELFDAEEGGFGNRPKFPHVPALTLALERHADTGDPRFARIVTTSLDRLVRLYDEIDGGFFRYASCRDWSTPHTEKILQDNAALIRLYVDAGEALNRDDYVDLARRAISWVHQVLGNAGDGGFAASQAGDGPYYSVGSGHTHAARERPQVDQTSYTDSTADMISACLRAADVSGDRSLAESALRRLDQVTLAVYQPGAGVAHVIAPDPAIWGLLADHVHGAETLLVAHATTGQLPYSMLATELMEHAIKTMWHDDRAAFRDRVSDKAEYGLMRRGLYPFVLNCEAARVLFRLSMITGRTTYHDLAQRTLAGLGSAYCEDPLVGASYGLAMREIRDGRPPRGLSLSYVDWKLWERDED